MAGGEEKPPFAVPWKGSKPSARDSALKGQQAISPG